MNRDQGEGGRTLERAYAIAIAAAFGVAAALGLLILSERFDFEIASVIDDWVYAMEPDKSVRQLGGQFFDPIGQNRFRPGYDLWTHVQWHMPGGPQEMIWPNLFGSVRVLLTAAALVIVPGVVAATSRPRPDPLLLAALCFSAMVVLFAGPAVGPDYLRLGTQEPLMFPATVCGIAIVVWATGRLIQGRAEGPWPTLALIAGLLLWSLGIYFKEASIALLAGSPFLYLHLDRRWQAAGVLSGPLWRSRIFQVVALAVSIAPIHVAIGSASVSGETLGPYGAEKPDSIGAWIERAADSINLQWDAIPAAQVPEWRYLVLALPVLVAVVWVRQRRPPWLPIALLTAGAAVLTAQSAVLISPNRYLIPGIGLFAGAAVLLISQLPRWAGWAATAAALVLALSNQSQVRQELADYSDWETEGNAPTIEFVSELNPGSCPVYLANLGVEMGESLPRLVSIEDQASTGPCESRFEGVIAGYEHAPDGPLTYDDALLRACNGPEVLHSTPGYDGYPLEPPFPGWRVIGCREFSEDKNSSTLAPLLSQSRLVPGVSPTEVRSRCAERFALVQCAPVLRGQRPAVAQ